MGPANLRDSATQAPCASSPEQPPLNSQPHGLPDHSSPSTRGPTFPLYRVFLSPDDFYASTLFLDKNTGTTSNIPTGWLNDRKPELVRRELAAQQNRAIARATRKRLLAEECFAEKQAQEMRAVQTALHNFESGSVSNPLSQTQASLAVMQAVHETLLAKQLLVQKQLNEAELRMQVIHDDMEDVQNQIALSSQQLGDLLREMNLPGMHPTVNPLDDHPMMNPLDDHIDTDSDSMDDSIADDHSEASPSSEHHDLVASVRSGSSDGVVQYFDALVGDELEAD